MGKEKAKEKPQRGSVQVWSPLLSVGYRCVEVLLTCQACQGQLDFGDTAGKWVPWYPKYPLTPGMEVPEPFFKPSPTFETSIRQHGWKQQM